MQKHSVTVVLGTHSTTLIECWLQGVAAVMISSSYDYAWHLVEEGLISSFPCAHRDGAFGIVPDVPIDDFSRAKIDATVNELKEEKTTVADLLPG